MLYAKSTRPVLDCRVVFLGSCFTQAVEMSLCEYTLQDSGRSRVISGSERLLPRPTRHGRQNMVDRRPGPAVSPDGAARCGVAISKLEFPFAYTTITVRSSWMWAALEWIFKQALAMKSGNITRGIVCVEWKRLVESCFGSLHVGTQIWGRILLNCHYCDGDVTVTGRNSYVPLMTRRRPVSRLDTIPSM